jgi:hypothetical protein
MTSKKMKSKSLSLPPFFALLEDRSISPKRAAERGKEAVIPAEAGIQLLFGAPEELDGSSAVECPVFARMTNKRTQCLARATTNKWPAAT